jgi:hypothetical protein
MFSDFPESWPLRTKVLFSYYQYTVLLPLLVALVWYFWPNKAFRGRAAIGLASVISVAVIAFFYWSIAPSELVLEAIRRSN